MILSADPLHSNWNRRPPPDVLRPPVAVGPLPVDEDLYAGWQGGERPSTPKGQNFRKPNNYGKSTGWSVPPSRDEGWQPATSSSRQLGVPIDGWSAEPVYADDLPVASGFSRNDNWDVRGAALVDNYDVQPKSFGGCGGANQAGCDDWRQDGRGLHGSDWVGGDFCSRKPVHNQEIYRPCSGQTATVDEPAGVRLPARGGFSNGNRVPPAASGNGLVCDRPRPATPAAISGARINILTQTQQVAAAAAATRFNSSCLRSPETNYGRQPSQAIATNLKLAEQWASNHAKLPIQNMPSVTYPCGTRVDFQETANAFAPIAASNQPHRSRVIAAIESGELLRQTLRVYMACDKDGNGFLSWNNGEIQAFISTLFQLQGLNPPDVYQMYQLYLKFDTDKDTVLDSRECLCLVDALFRSIFFPGPVAPQISNPVAIAQPTRPPNLPTEYLQPFGAAMTADRQVTPIAIQLAGPQGVTAVVPTPFYVPAAPVPAPAVAIGVPQAMQIPRGLADPAAHFPRVAPAAAVHLLAPHGSSQQLAKHPSEVGEGLNHPSHRHIDDDDAAHHLLPPGWHEHEDRPHILEVDLEELELRPEADHMQPAWYETVQYFLSLHPHSEHHSSIPLPKHPPRASVEGQYLVSKIHVPVLPEVTIQGSPQRGRDGDGGQRHPHVPFNEHLELETGHLDTHLVAYLWGHRKSMANEEFTLVGRSLAPLHDYKFQRKFTTWGVFDVVEEHRVADLRLKYNVVTTPSAVQRPRAAEVHQDRVTLQWTAPASDHGAPLMGYRISILLDKQHNEGPQWHTVCELTKSLKPSFVVANLRGNTVYLLDLQAVNKAGAGDPCEFQVQTAPCEPDPPSKPWVDQRKDDRFNLKWCPSESDGGYRVKYYKIRMRKIVGASRWNRWTGPGDTKATWVDMGTVAASEKEQQEPSVYNAWLGPIERNTCEYRFQIVAANKMGEGDWSELSEPEYT